MEASIAAAVAKTPWPTPQPWAWPGRCSAWRRGKGLGSPSSTSAGAFRAGTARSTCTSTTPCLMANQVLVLEEKSVVRLRRANQHRRIARLAPPCNPLLTLGRHQPRTGVGIAAVARLTPQRRRPMALQPGAAEMTQAHPQPLCPWARLLELLFPFWTISSLPAAAFR